MRYKTIDELAHFEFEDAVINEIEIRPGSVVLQLDNVTILPENSCNRDIRKMRTHGLQLQFLEGQLVRLVEEGYKVYDADGHLRQEVEDREMTEEETTVALKELADLYVYQIQKKGTVYSIIIDGEDHSFRLEIQAQQDVAQWDKFLSMDTM